MITLYASTDCQSLTSLHPFPPITFDTTGQFQTDLTGVKVSKISGSYSFHGNRWLDGEERPYSYVCFGKKCGMRSTVLLDTNQFSWERQVMNALNKGKALTEFLTFLDMRVGSTRVITIRKPAFSSSIAHKPACYSVR